MSHLRILIVLAHPAYQRSRANRELAEAASRVQGVLVHDLYEAYPDFFIDVPREQRLLLVHDLVVFQYPFYWYSSPALLKEWQDLVLEHGWAYGREGTALAGKALLATITAAGSRQDYTPAGHHGFTVRQLLTPVEQTARRCGMRFLPPFVVHDTRRRGVDEATGAVAAGFARALAGLRDGRLAEPDLAGCEYLNDHPLLKDASDD